MTPPTHIRDKLAQLLFIRIGSNMTPIRTVEDDESRVALVLDEYAIGGLCPLNGRGPDTAGALSRLQKRSRIPFLVGTDMERGLGQQFEKGTTFPHARAFGVMAESAEKMVGRFARFSAREALASGIHISFSPVADVNQIHDNPIIATRSFGEDPELVAKLVRANIRGNTAEGLLSTAKHFPGHGDTNVDSHETLPVVTSSRHEMAAMDLLPFRAAIDAGVPLIMSAHVAYPSLDLTGHPATLSRAILVDLLRKELGFKGVVISDSMLMKGIRRIIPDEGELAVAALNAGVDLLLDVESPDSVLAVLEKAVILGRLDEARVEEAFLRTWMLKIQLCERFGDVSFFHQPERFVPVPDPESGRSFAMEVARKSVIMLDTREIRMLSCDDHDIDNPMLAILVKSSDSYPGPSGQPLVEALRQRFDKVEYKEIGPGTGENTLFRLTERAAQARQVLVAVVLKPAAWQRLILPSKLAGFIETLTRNRPLVLASLGVPTVLEAFPFASVRICTFSDVACSQRALAERFADIINAISK